MANHHIAFDESGKQDREYIVFAGLVSLPDRWVDMQKNGTKLLKAKAYCFRRKKEGLHKGVCAEAMRLFDETFRVVQRGELRAEC